ncbi:ATP-dependent RNA helicase DbpA [Clostridium perfringens D str. JGS1721]|uniref:ATP-dependent RNA helicase DbpA n=1 Tax=Clostridium perfringens D str. JGS1721 TaxID=488537 RepID=B1V1Y2_CLOPF|nr:DEAD/DEAH box helicase [Clostridium perfringens]EDT72182.1 ATP-dependent RNA helicase DbpA [Clostridium perfringens D str. JGS1721]
MKFNELNLSEDIIKALNNLGYKNPSEVQEASIPKLLKGEDIIVKSQTGSGKTASFGIPVCEKINIEEKKVQCLVLTPTRELAIQVKDELSNIGRIKKVRCAAIFGKQPFNEQIRELKQRVHIVVGTPGRVFDHMERGTLDLSEVNYVVIDEADKMLSMGFIDQIKDILGELRLNKTTALFSATFSKEIEEICEEYMRNPMLLEVKSKVFNRDRIEESAIEIEEKNKVKSVYKMLKDEGITCNELHGDMEQKKRIEVMENFRDKHFKVLVCTDIAARGIHVDSIELVINYEVPMETESYVHRIGRTGRAGREGKAITFVNHYEKKYLENVEEYIGYEIRKASLPSDDEVKAGRKIFKESQKVQLKESKKPKKEVHGDIVKIHVNGGKKKKIRAFDIVGCFSNLPGLTGEDIGIIDVQDGFSYVDILNGKGDKVLKSFKEVTIKGKKVKIQKARK